MYFETLHFQHLRNLAALELHPEKTFNFIWGENASGKTSILEGIYLLTSGKSFRVHSKHPVIAHNQAQLTLYGKVIDDQQKITIGYERQRVGKNRLLINGQSSSSNADLARLFPVQLINSTDFDLLLSSPEIRRQFLDWGLFHVKHHFHQLWKNVRHILQQRNAALKQQSARNIVEAWDKELVPLVEELENLRQQYLVDLIAYFLKEFAVGVDMESIRVEYYKGWPEDQDFEVVLRQSYFRDLKQGYTSFGPHRSDWQLFSGGDSAKMHFSRGQQKTLIALLKISQLHQVKALTKKTGIILIDDLLAELDDCRAQLIVDKLVDSYFQVFITGIKFHANFGIIKAKWFHVKHGIVEEVVNKTTLTELAYH